MENAFAIALELAKYTIPALVVVLAVYVLMSNHFSHIEKIKNYDLGLKVREQVLPIKLQAYERITLLLERIQPANLIMRMGGENMTAPEFQFALVTTIRKEFEHNIAQQIYVSDEAWMLIRASVEELIQLINTIGKTLPNEATSTDFSKALLHYLVEHGTDLSITNAGNFLKQEVTQFF